MYIFFLSWVGKLQFPKSYQNITRANIKVEEPVVFFETKY